MSQCWHQLLIHWNEREFRHSLTFPFLVGALRKPPGTPLSSEATARAELEALLREIAGFESEHDVFHVYRCPSLGELVLHRVNGKHQPPGSVAIVYHPSSKGGLFASDTSLKGAKASPEALAGVIWQEVGDAIIEGKFSCNGGEYNAFSDYDLGIISRAFA